VSGEWARHLATDWREVEGTRVYYGPRHYRVWHEFGEVEVWQQRDGHWYCAVKRIHHGDGASTIVQGERAEVLWKTPEEAVRVAQVWLTENDARRRLGG